MEIPLLGMRGGFFVGEYFGLAAGEYGLLGVQKEETGQLKPLGEQKIQYLDKRSPKRSLGDRKKQ
jgi:hypothetical protein